MRFRRDDLDWAMGELLALFVRANEAGIYPHLLDPDLFHEAWCVLNAQPFEVAKPMYDLLIRQITRPLGAPPRRVAGERRYENPLPA